VDYQELIKRLRQYNGIVECRVQHPQTGCYCISYDWHNSFNPKRNADEWLADHKKRFPDHEYSTTYVVKEVRVPSQQDEACQEAADAIESLLTENERLKAELAKYRYAPVVAYLYKYRNCFGDEVWTTDHNWGNRIPFESKPLIVKPGENK